MSDFDFSGISPPEYLRGIAWGNIDPGNENLKALLIWAASRKIIPNRNTIAVKPYKHVEMTKSEMYEMLRKAVENTK